ncbi:MAG: hypothetical protein IPJ31_08585 [Bacteroidetes bacterium]|nr:hypothetical protein [Bacteroidota bacterium]
MVDAITCLDDLKKENSLLITDLSVVEDINRTYNVVAGTGNATGVWTFGEMMKNIANTNANNGVKDFLKSWVKLLRLDNVVAMNQFIGPWISKARGLNTPINVQKDMQAANIWETEWDNALTTEEGLLQNAPFKLTAIVNRIDLRQNVAYMQNMSNTGETRFIFTMVNPYTGQIPLLDNNDFTSQNFIDWKGFNVIFEYGNIQTNLCDLQNFALQWYNLSSLTLGSTDYLDALELITNSVTLPNVAPSRPNGKCHK